MNLDTNLGMNLESNAFLPLRDAVFHTLRKSILTGELKPGERLMEIHLADKLGVSRTPIREAIRMLELEGLVTMIPRRGAEVAQITEKSMQDVLEVRRALDALCAELACERISNDDLISLQQACREFEESVKTGELTEIAKCDVALHNIIVLATGNSRLVQLVNNLSEQMYRYRFEYIKDKAKHSALIEEHNRILQALQARDKTAAALAATEHIDNQKNAIIQTIRSEQAGK